MDVAERLLAVQAQDPRGARLAIRARSTRTAAAGVDRELTEERSLVITWLNRGTLHLVRSEDRAWLHAVTAPPQLTANARRPAEEGVSPDAAEAVVTRALGADGPQTREQLRDQMAAAGVRTAGQALAHVLMRALRGLVVRGPMVGAGTPTPSSLTSWARRRASIATPRRPSSRAATSPATARPVRPTPPAGRASACATPRAGLQAIAPALTERPGGLVELAGRPPPAALPPLRLLGAFDPLLHGWVSREPVLGSHAEVVTRNGIFRPFLLVDGRAAGTWRLRDGRVALEPFAPLGAEVAAALEADAADVLRFLG